MPRYRPGDVVYILSEWEGRRGDSFVVDKIKTRRGKHFYYDESSDWTSPFYLETFDGWWEEELLSEEFPGYGDC